MNAGDVEDTATRDPGPADARQERRPPPRDPREAQGSPGSGAGAVAPWIVAVVAVAVAVVALVQWWQLDRGVADDREAREVAGQVVAALTNWQADDLSSVRGILDRHGTERFTDEASQLLDQFAQGLQQAEARSTGEILNLVADAEEGAAGAVALAVVRQEVTNTSLEQPDVQCWGTRVVLQRRSDSWLVDGVELYGPNQCPDADQAPADAPTAERTP